MQEPMHLQYWTALAIGSIAPTWARAVSEAWHGIKRVAKARRGETLGHQKKRCRPSASPAEESRERGGTIFSGLI